MIYCINKAFCLINQYNEFTLNFLFYYLIGYFFNFKYFPGRGLHTMKEKIFGSKVNPNRLFTLVLELFFKC